MVAAVSLVEFGSDRRLHERSAPLLGAWPYGHEVEWARCGLGLRRDPVFADMLLPSDMLGHLLSILMQKNVVVTTLGGSLLHLPTISTAYAPVRLPHSIFNSSLLWLIASLITTACDADAINSYGHSSNA